MKRVFLTFLVLAVTTGAALAQGMKFATDSDAPVDITAGLVDWYGDERRADFSAQAVFAQGPLLMRAASMQLFLSADGAAESLTAHGAVEVVSKNQYGKIIRQARAANAVYHPVDEKLVLTGNVEVRESGERDGLLRGEKMTIDMRSGRAALQGDEKKGRARIELR